jgi:hypothetical protein
MRQIRTTCVNRRQLPNKKDGMSQFPVTLCSRIKHLCCEWLTGGETWINHCTTPVNDQPSEGVKSNITCLQSAGHRIKKLVGCFASGHTGKCTLIYRRNTAPSWKACERRTTWLVQVFLRDVLSLLHDDVQLRATRKPRNLVQNFDLENLDHLHTATFISFPSFNEYILGHFQQQRKFSPQPRSS